MKLRNLLIIAILLTSCTNTDLATDEQKNWCYLKSNNFNTMERQEFLSYFDAFDLYNIENDSDIKPSKFAFSKKLTEGDAIALRICKIWADMNNE